MTNVREAAGGLLVVGLGSTELSGLERAWLKLVRPAGIILFQRNIADARQTRALLDEATAPCAPHSLRCVDVEGGTVDRLREALAPLPSAQAVAHATRIDASGQGSSFPWPQNRDASTGSGQAQGDPIGFAREHGELVAQAVKAFGFNTTLAPVLDLALPESSQVMGTRAAAATAGGVVDYARDFLAGLAAHGVVGCGKHFPGLGGGTLDSHLSTPAIRLGSRELWTEDLAPYRALRNELPMVMVSHASYPNTRGKDRPASVSAYWITEILRKRIGYGGIIFSDDLEMGGILKFLPIEEAVIAGARAGMDLMEICHSPELILRAYEALLREGERSGAFRTLLLARSRRTLVKRARLSSGEVSKALTARQIEQLRARILKFGERVALAQPATEAGSR
jgi:beta-N-acetylhexosaminidase